jgi:hypothetical protein
VLTYQVENQDYCSWDSPSHRYFASSKRSIIAVNILGYSVCNSLISFEAGNVPEVVSVDVNAFCISSNCRYSVYKRIYGFFLVDNADAVVYAGICRLLWSIFNHIVK